MKVEFLRAAALTATLAALPLATSAAQTVKLGTLAPKGSPWHQALQDMAVEWQKISEGRVTVRIYPGGVAGDEADMVRKMRIGQLSAAALTGNGLAAITKEIQALQMPMMFRSDAELDHVRNRLVPKLSSDLERNGFTVLNWADAGWVHFFTKTPVVHPDDLKPLKLFAWVGETAHIAAWRKAGYQPVPLPATEIHTALSSGLIDAIPTTPIAALSFQWFGIASHMTSVKWAPLVGATVVSRRTWRKIPKRFKARLMNSAEKTGRRLQEKVRRLGPEAVRVMKSHGLTVHEVPADVMRAWEERARRGHSSLVGSIVPADTVAEVERLRDAYRSEHGAR